MPNEISTITGSIFNGKNPDDVAIEEIENSIALYPYFAPVRLLLAKKAAGGNINQPEAAVTAGLYLHNPLLLDWIMRTEPEAEEPGGEPHSQQEEKQRVQSGDDSPIVFQSYHTVDYFASQGIRLQQSDLNRGKLGQQMKSFTEWLRGMKKLPAAEAESVIGKEDPQRHYHVMQSAAHSIEAKEILTETMAEVWVKQGHPEKAVAIYQKLSLQNPGKSGYFAAKIDHLKAL